MCGIECVGGNGKEDNRMHVVFATHSYWPHQDGVQMVNQYLAEGLVRAGHKVTILTNRLDGYNEHDSHNGVEIYRFIHKLIFKFNFGESRKFKKFLLENEEDIDVLIVVGAQSFAGEWTMQISNKLSCKKIMYMHGMRSEYMDISRIKTVNHFFKESILTIWFRVYFKRYWHKIMEFDAAIHLFERDNSLIYFKKYGFNNNFVIKNSCDKTLFEEKKINKDLDRIKEKYEIRNKYFLSVANYGKNKNQKRAIKAYYDSETEDISLVFIGSERNKYFEELERLNFVMGENGKGTHEVKLLYGVSREDTVNLIKGAYAIVLSSDNEYFPVTILEGLAAGKPYISTNVGVVPQIPGGVIAHNDSEFAYWIEYFAKYPQFAEELKKIGKEYALRELYVEDKIQQLENIIKSIGIGGVLNDPSFT